jgi:predicted PhzF superfamily epimerase YddE/YHI9
MASEVRAKTAPELTDTDNAVPVDVVRVFVDSSGRYGNLLGIVDGSLVPTQSRQRFAAAVGYSETVFVDDATEGLIEIFTPTMELPYAGHPTVGTAWWLHSLGYDADRLVVPAGTIEVLRNGDVTRVLARIEWAHAFTWHQLDSPADVEAVDPSSYGEGANYVWAWIDEDAGTVRSRMFAAEMGIVEDQATGAAAIGFTGVQERDLDITQGEGSRISTTFEAEGWATVGGLVVPEPSRSVPL